MVVLTRTSRISRSRTWCSTERQYGAYILLIFVVGFMDATAYDTMGSQESQERVGGVNSNAIFLPLNRRPHTNHTRSLLASSTMSVFGSVRDT
eukprot:1685931-Pyramimonas_sp.AAC.1